MFHVKHYILKFYNVSRETFLERTEFNLENLIKLINQYLPLVVIGMMVIILVLFILVIALWKSMNRVEKRYRKLMRGSDNKNLEKLINEKLESIELSTQAADEAKELVNEIKANLNECVQKVAIMRYKAFDDVGSDLSFSIAILDGHNDGIILTGLYGRHDSTTFAKPIDKGISRYELSEEEQIVLKEAINKKSI